MEEKSLWLDNEKASYSSEMPFGSLSENIRKHLGEQRIVSEVWLDGQALNLEEEQAIQQKPIGDLGEIQFVSKDVQTLFYEALQMAPQVCDALGEQSEAINSSFAKGELQTAHQHVADWSALMEWLLHLVQGLRTYGTISVDEIVVENEKASDSFQRMEQHLQTLQQAFASQNFTSFNQELQGTFKKELGLWKSIFHESAKNWTPPPSDSGS